MPWRLLEKGAQTGRDATGDEGIVIAPEINPGGRVDRDLVDQIFTDRKMAFAKTFLADGIGRGIEEAGGDLVRAEFFEALGRLVDEGEAGQRLGGPGKFVRQVRQRLQLLQPASARRAVAPTGNIGEKNGEDVWLERGNFHRPEDEILLRQPNECLRFDA